MSALTIAPNVLYTGDNLPILHGFNSESVDLIYLDPPFNTKKMYKAPVGSKAAGASFKDMWTWEDVDRAYLEGMVDDYPFMVQFIGAIYGIHGKAMASYVTYMAQRLIEMHRVLKSTGSLYLHCDPTASHYLKILCDRIFGKKNFRNEIIWHYGRWTAKANFFQKQHDVIFFYSKTKKHQFYTRYKAHSENALKEYKYLEKPNGECESLKGSYSYKDLMEMEGRVFRTLRRKDTRGTDKDKQYLDTVPGVRESDVFQGIRYLSGNAKERVGYPTQKPLKLLERIIEASSNKGDIVLDPFCGCATTCVAAQQLGRKWIGIDLSEKSAKLVVDRLSEHEQDTTRKKADNGRTKGTFIFKDFTSIVIDKEGKLLPQRTDVQEVDESDFPVKKRLYKEQDGKCNGCFVEFEMRNLETDHIVPKSRGGGNFYENYQLLCGNCNRVKGAKPMEYLRNKITKRNKMMKYDMLFGIEETEKTDEASTKKAQEKER